MSVSSQRVPGAVVAALDASGSDPTVVARAAAEADRAGAALRLVTVVDAGLQLTPYEALVSGAPSLAQQVDADARSYLTEVAARLRDSHPGLGVGIDVPWGSPVTGLVRASETARLLVLGSSAHSGFGAVVTPVAAHARCPVLVVPEDGGGEEPRRVVVGVDGSEPSLRALDTALTIADAGGVVTCVAAWRTEVEGGMLVSWPVADASATVEERFEEVLERALVQRAGEHPGVGTRSVVRHGHAADVLLDVAREVDADLVVVGSRGHGGFVGLLLGSVSRRLLNHADRPVLVVH